MEGVNYPIEIDGVFIGTVEDEYFASIHGFLLEMPYDINRWHKSSYDIWVTSIQIFNEESKAITEEIILGSSVNAKTTKNMELSCNNRSIIAYKLLTDDEKKVFESKKNNFLPKKYKILEKGDELTKKSFW